MYEDPQYANAARRGQLRAEADRYRLAALVRGCRQTLVRRLAIRAHLAQPC